MRQPANGGDSEAESTLQATATQSRRRAHNDDSDDGADADASMTALSSATHQSLVKNLVRLALASEYSRIPLRRPDINAKVLQPAAAPSRAFQSVFDDAQLALKHTFGMELVELPPKDKVTLAQRRKAGTQPTQPSQASSSKSWILVSNLPARYRGADTEVLPSRAPTRDREAEYIGLCTIVVAMVAIAGGQISHAALERQLRRVNAERNMPGGPSTEKVLLRMIKDGYVMRVKETAAGEENIDYYLGPRGKMEIGEAGVAGLVRQVWRGEGGEELETKLERTLKVSGIRVSGDATRPSAHGEPQAAEAPTRRGRPRRNEGDEED